MPFRISFFKTPPHKVFNYTPRYWYPEKEAREARNVKSQPSLVRGCFQEIRQRGHKRNSTGTVGRIVLLATIAALLIAALYFSKFIELVLQKVAG
jgi:predicted transcriptional regulator with HTH domain